MEKAEVGKYKLICFTSKGREVMDKLCANLKIGVERYVMNSLIAGGMAGGFSEADAEQGLSEWTRKVFKTGNTLIFIGACGIAVRAIAPFIEDKTTDPGVLVVDENARFVIPILSGHLGGAVDEAHTVARILDAQAVITTATDVRGEFAVDVFAKSNDLIISDMKKAKDFTARLLETGSGSFYVDQEFRNEILIGEKPDNIIFSKETFDIYISPCVFRGDALRLIPRSIVIGMGCRRGKSGEDLTFFAWKCLNRLGIDKRAIKALVSADIKTEEQGLIETAEAFDAEFKTFSEVELARQVGDFTGSDFVKETVGVDNVCERAVMAYGCSRIILHKVAENGMTFAAGVLPKTLNWHCIDMEK